MEAANFLSGKSMRASCGLKAPAHRDRRSAVFELFLLREVRAEGEEGIKFSSSRDVRY